MARREGSFRTDWSAERNSPKRSDFHHEQQVFRKHEGEDAEPEDDWLLNAPGKASKVGSGLEIEGSVNFKA